MNVPMVLLLGVLVAGGFGSWGILRHWRHLVETQLRLDQCVGSEAKNLRNMLNRIDSTNQTIYRLRLAIAGSALLPEALPALRTALQAAVAAQEVERIRWQANQLTWIARRGCRSSGDIPLPLPQMRWTRLPPDLLGPQALRWDGPSPSSFRIQVHHSPRAAAAIVHKKPEETHATKWKAQWTGPS